VKAPPLPATGVEPVATLLPTPTTPTPLATVLAFP